MLAQTIYSTQQKYERYDSFLLSCFILLGTAGIVSYTNIQSRYNCGFISEAYPAPGACLLITFTNKASVPSQSVTFKTT